MGAFSSTLASCCQHAKSLLISSNSGNNTTSLPLNQQSLSILAPANPETPVGISERITEQVLPMAIAIVVGLLALLGNLPTSVHNRITLYKFYLLFYFLSFFWAIVPLVFTIDYIPKPSQGVAWLQKQTIKMAIVFIVISVTLKIFLLLPPPIVWYEGLIPLPLVGAISLYLWYDWIKAKNSTQTTSSPAVTSSFTSED